jgi:hypothetical protein
MKKLNSTENMKKNISLNIHNITLKHAENATVGFDYETTRQMPMRTTDIEMETAS